MHFLLLAVLIILGGCTSVSVQKVDSSDTTTAGFRFSLPSRFVMVEPQADGGMTAKIMHLPDADNHFAITGRTIFGKNKLIVTVAEGILKDVSFEGDATAVASQVATSGGAVEAKEQEVALAAAKASNTKARELRNALATAEIEEEQAKKRYDVVREALGESHENTVEAQVLWELAKIKTRDLREKVNELGSAANDPSLYNDSSAAPLSAFGPMFFRIVDVKTNAGHRVLLEPVTDQQEFKVRMGGSNKDSEESVACPVETELLQLVETALQDSKIRIRLNMLKEVQVGVLELAEFDDPDRTLITKTNIRLPAGEFDIVSEGARPATEYQLVLKDINGEADCELILDVETR